MWSVDIPKKAHWVKKIFFFPPEPPGGARFFYYMEIEAAVLAMFEDESIFFLSEGGPKTLLQASSEKNLDQALF